jgi:hypothetical protein
VEIVTDERPNRADDAKRPVEKQWRTVLIEDYGVEPSRARAICATAVSDPELTLGPPDAEEIRTAVEAALDDFDFESVLDDPGRSDELRRDLLAILDEGLDGIRYGPAVAPPDVREASGRADAPTDDDLDQVLPAVRQALEATDWSAYGVDEPDEPFVSETVARVADRLGVGGEAGAETETPDAPETPERPDSPPSLGTDVSAAAERGYNFEKPGDESERSPDDVDPDDLPTVTSASTIRDIIDASDLHPAQLEGLVEYLQAQLGREDDGT